MALTIEERIPLKDKTSFRVGGDARFFARVASVEELKEALAFAAERKLPVLVLGGGSNVLIDDAGFPGLVLKLELTGITFTENADNTVFVTAAAGESWDALVEQCVERGLYGVENMSGIPGSVGATPIQNVGAYGTEVKDVIHSVEALNTETGAVKTFSNNDCAFSYRNSFFKTAEGKKYVIIRVTYKLKKDGALDTSYRDVAEYFASRNETPTLTGVRTAILEIRSRKFPDLNICGTAGSFFKNPIIAKAERDTLIQRYPDLPSFPVTENSVKVPAGWLIEHVGGFKGAVRGNVTSHEKQALVLVNTGSATAQEILSFAREIQADIYKKTNIQLEFEVQCIDADNRHQQAGGLGIQEERS